MARQVLENGVILPAEYSDDWYDDMTSNLTKLDDVIGSDSEKLSSADVGAAALSNNYNDLDNLPTIPTVNDATLTIQKNGTTVNTFTANASSNVTANITVPTKTSDLTNDSNFVDTSNSAVASGITSAKVTSYDNHIADTDIHVTTSDKSKWNDNVSQSYVLRYASTSVTPSSTIAYSVLNNTDNVKVGDSVIDSSGQVFLIVSVDSANETVTVGAVLLTLALDANVVHKSGNESVGGKKTFTNDITLQNSNTSGLSNSYICKSQVAVLGDAVSGDSTKFSYVDKNNAEICYIRQRKLTNSNTDMSFCIKNIDNDNNSISAEINYVIDRNNEPRVSPSITDYISLGRSSFKWKAVYATSYYYGADNTEFSTKFVTTDTNQTVSGKKTFLDDLTIYNNDTSQSTKNLNISSSKIQLGDRSNSDAFGIRLNAGASYVAQILAVNDTTGTQNLQLSIRTKDGSDNLITSMARLRLFASGNSSFESGANNSTSLGSSSFKWKDVQTNQINGLTPSSLGMPVTPSTTSYVDISSYITVLDSSSANTYTPPSNGYITFSVTGSLVQVFHDYGLQGKWTVQAGNANRGFIPVLGGVEVKIYITASSINKFWFIPCQGNV